MSKAQEVPDRNLGMELVRVTEAAAMAGARWMGRGDKEQADGAAVDAMRAVLSGVSMDGTYWVNAIPNLSNFYNVAFASTFGDQASIGFITRESKFARGFL